MISTLESFWSLYRPITLGSHCWYDGNSLSLWSCLSVRPLASQNTGRGTACRLDAASAYLMGWRVEKRAAGIDIRGVPSLGSIATWAEVVA
eukprot:4852678-Amphidinium_carterae.1